MRVVAIVQARLNSKRLPRKVLAELGGIPSLAWTLRAAKAAQNVDAVWLAIPVGDVELARLAHDNGMGSTCWCGPELDVLERYRQAAEASKADVIVRLTGDCPFLDPALIDECIEHHCDNTEQWPDGLDVQVFRTHMLEFGDTEHVVSPKWVRPQLKCPAGNIRHIKVSLDTHQDLLDLRWVASKLPGNRAPTWRETLDAVYGIESPAGASKEDYTPSEPNVQQGVEPVAG